MIVAALYEAEGSVYCRSMYVNDHVLWFCKSHIFNLPSLRYVVTDVAMAVING